MAGFLPRNGTETGATNTWWAERLSTGCSSLNASAMRLASYIPQRDLERLLFHGLLPEPLSEDELRDLLGVSKYRAYLNFHYGVVLEEALQLAAEEYVRKRHLARGFSDSEELVEEAFRHLYTKTRADLLDEYRAEARLGKRQGLNLSDLKEFTYWLHKRRVNYWDPARVAYDTRLAILRLESLRETAYSATLLQ